jgi:hypothetical protein
MKKLIFLFFLALSIFSSSVVFAMEEKDKGIGYFIPDSYFEENEASSQGPSVFDNSGNDDSSGSDSDTDSSYSGAEEESEADSDSDDAYYEPIRKEEFSNFSRELQEQLEGSVNSEDERYYIILHLLVMLEDALENKTSKKKLEKFIRYYENTGAQCRAVENNLRKLLESIVEREPRDEDGDIPEPVRCIYNAICDEYSSGFYFSSKAYLVDVLLMYLHKKFVNKKSSCVTKLFLDFVAEIKFSEKDLVDRHIPHVSKSHKVNVIQSYERWLKISKQTIYETSEFDAFNTACLTDYNSVEDHRVLFSMLLRALWQRYIFEQTKQRIVMKSNAWTQALKCLYLLIPDILNGDI